MLLSELALTKVPEAVLTKVPEAVLSKGPEVVSSKGPEAVSSKGLEAGHLRGQGSVVHGAEDGVVRGALFQESHCLMSLIVSKTVGSHLTPFLDSANKSSGGCWPKDAKVAGLLLGSLTFIC